jgi:hypothetical protein
MLANKDIVSIMDLLMFEAQRQGRLSFYMVGWRMLCEEGSNANRWITRFPLARKA